MTDGIPSQVVDALDTEQGSPLPNPDLWAQRIGADVGRARLVTGPAAAAAAAAIDARAFTVGDRVFFGSGSGPTTDNGDLLAHELTHVVQQRGASRPESWEDIPLLEHSDPREVDARSLRANGAGGGMAIARESGPPHVTARQYIDSADGGSVRVGQNGLYFVYIFKTISERLASLGVVEHGPFGEFLQSAFAETFEQEMSTSNGLRTFKISLLSSAPKGSRVWESLGAEKLEEILQPESLTAVVDRARPLDYVMVDDDHAAKSNKGPNDAAFVDVVALEIAAAIARRYKESIQRMFPRFLSAYLDQTKIFLIDDKGNSRPAANYNVNPEKVLVSHPIDLYVIDSLCRTQDKLDWKGIEAKYPELRSDPSIPTRTISVQMAPTGPRGTALYHWVQAPEDATAEEVARALFGGTEQAHRLVPMKPLWGFRVRDLAVMDGAKKLELVKALAARGPMEAPDLAWELNPVKLPPSIVAAPPEIDPGIELIASGGEKLAMDRAKLGPKPEGDGPHDEKSIVAKINENIKNLDTLRVTAEALRHPVDSIDAAMQRALGRQRHANDECLADTETPYALADQQGKVLGTIATAMATALAKLAKLDAPSQAVAFDPVSEAIAPLFTALDVLELPELATPRAAAGEQLVAKLDIAILEAKAHDSLPRAQNAMGIDNVGGVAYDPRAARAQSEIDLETLAQLRISGDENAPQMRKTLAEMTPRVDRTLFESSVGERLFALDALWSAIDSMDDFWTGGAANIENSIGSTLKSTNRTYYTKFKEQVYDLYEKAQKEPDKERADEMAKDAKEKFATFVADKAFQAHAQQVLDHLERAARNKKWAKIIAAIVIAVVAFGIGAWEFALLAPELGTAASAVVAGITVTEVQTALDAIVLDQAPTPGGLVTGLITNIAMFGFLGESLSIAKAAGAEAEAVEGVRAAEGAAEAAGTAAKGSKVGAIAKEAVKQLFLAEAIGMVNAEVAKQIDQGKNLTKDEMLEIAGQQVIGLVGMTIGQYTFDTAITSIKSSVLRYGIDAKWFKTEQAEIKAMGDRLGAKVKAGQKPSRGEALELLSRWEKYRQREQAAREKIIDLAQSHPELIKASDVARLQQGAAHPDLMLQLQQAKGMLGIEQYGPGLYRCEPLAFDGVLAAHKSSGGLVVKVETDTMTGQRTATVKTADGAKLQITEKLPPADHRAPPPIPIEEARSFEAWLDGLSAKGVTESELSWLRTLYAKDPQAALNVGEQQGYQLKTKAGTGENKPGGTPPLATGEVDAAKALGVTALGGNKYQTMSGHLRGVHEAQAAKPETKTTRVHYDPESNTAWFETEITIGGKPQRVIVQAELPPRITSASQLASGANRIVGLPVSVEQGHAIMERLNHGDASALAETGVTGVGELPKGVEFGLGRTSDGRAVIVRGANGHVDWEHLPGIEPREHTHPDLPGLTSGNDLPIVHGERSFPVTELRTKTDVPLANREKVFPSGADTILMGYLEVDGHVVHTPFIVKDGMVMKAPPGDTGPRLQFTIKGPRELGTSTVPGKGRVFAATIEGRFNGDLVVSEKVWVVEEGNSSEGHNFLTEPSYVPKAAKTTPHAMKTPVGKPPDLPTIKAHLDSAARTHVAAEKDLPPFEVDVLPAEDFAAKYRSESGRAVFTIDDGKVRIIASAEATPADVIAETYHLRQMKNPKMAAEIRKLQGVDMSKWDSMSVTDRMELFRRKLKIEIDAHEAMVRDGVAGARDQLANLHGLERDAAAIRPDQLSKMNAGLEAPPPFLEDPAHLFQKIKNKALQDKKPVAKPTDTSVEITHDPKHSSYSTAYGKPRVTKVVQRGSEWQEQWQTTSGYDGKVRVTKDAVILTRADGGGQVRYKIENGGKARKPPADGKVGKGDVLIDEPRRSYRRVEVYEEGVAEPRVVEEIQRTDEKNWKPRGDDSTTRGGILEDAARAEVHDEIEAKRREAKDKKQYYDGFQVAKRADGTGFDDIVIEFTGPKSSPKARVRIREVKAYDDRYVPLAEFTAIKDNLVGNMNDLIADLRTAINEYGDEQGYRVPGLERASVEQLEAALDTIDRKRVEFEVVVSEETLMGDIGDHQESVLTALDKGVKQYGKLTTKDGGPLRVKDSYRKQAEAAAEAKEATKAPKTPP